MIKHSKQAHMRRRRIHSLGVFLLVLMHVVQPLMALSQSGCANAIGASLTGGSGSDRAEPCCCSAPSSVAQAVPVEQSEAPGTEENCCASGDDEAVVVPGHNGDRGEEAQSVEAKCACRMDPVPDSAPDAPVLFLLHGELGEVALGEWVRTHAKLFASLASWHPHLGFSPIVDDDWAAAEAQQGTPMDASPGHPGGTISWVLVVRGVGGFLAMSAVYRN